jgi:adenylate cyclase
MLAGQMTADPHGASPAPPADGEARVLLIDASKVGCLFFSRVFEKQPGMVVRSAAGLAAGFQLAAEFHPTVIVCGVDTEGSATVAWVTELKAHPATRELPVLAFSVIDDPELRRLALDAGAFDFAVKSPEIGDLVLKVREGSRRYHGAREAAVRREPAAGAEGDPRAARVLMIDDSRTLCLAFQRMLQGQTDIVFEFGTDPRAAVDLAQRFQPTVILLDLEMPEVTGFDLLPQLKSNLAIQRVPVIVLSGLGDPEVKARAFELGASDYAEKQMHAVELLSRIRYHNAAHHTARALDRSIQELTVTKRSLELQRNYVRSTFGRYLSDEVVSALLETPDGLQLGGEKREIAVMMADIRGFTAISERLAAEQVLAVLNNYLELMTGVLLRWNGTIDEILGDAILAVFGAPVQRPDDAARAVACAVEMQLTMDQVNEWNRDRGFPTLGMGIGINTGEVVVGNIGSARRAKYGVVGRNVNLAARIEGCTVGGQVMASASTLARCGGLLRVDGKMELRAKGVERPIYVYEIGGIGGQYGLSLPERSELHLRPLAHPLPVRLAVLEHKRSKSEVHEGTIVKAHAEAVEIRAPLEAEVLMDLRLTVLDDHGQAVTTELYGKIVAVGAAGRQCFVVRFTSVPPEAVPLLQAAT